MYKKIMIGMLGICLMLMLGASADAYLVCTKIGGTNYCKNVSSGGSIICGLNAKGLGNCTNNTTWLGCEATGTDEWLVACGNPGANSWSSPGIQTAYFQGTVEGATLVDATLCDANGVIKQLDVHAPPSDALLEAAWGAGACPNDNWYPIDVVPCRMTLVDYAMDGNGNILSSKTFTCTLPNCTTLGWDAVNQQFDKRQYECTEN